MLTLRAGDRGLARTMFLFGVLGIAIALMFIAADFVLGPLIGAGSVERVARVVSAVYPIVWPGQILLGALGLGRFFSWQPRLFFLCMALANCIPYAALGACFYFGRLGLRRLRSRGGSSGAVRDVRRSTLPES